MSVEQEKDLSKESEEGESTEQETVPTMRDTNTMSVEQEKELSKESEEREPIEQGIVTTMRDTNEMNVEQEKELYKESEESESVEGEGENKRSMDNAHGINERQENEMSEKSMDCDIYYTVNDSVDTIKSNVVLKTG
ncbi:protein PRRC2C-like [Mercenaria mercenaria]|uniref:protein PRRC2C-like n=1 Tax=Mercenaria mercenaria TaxID=6596 RepID=UPI00234EA109|nr:protein PRRC2C-like [Mercenaria mercenaria]XP_053379283.1 protein PRRC2C-like [Mercenaria mercenaria]